MSETTATANPASSALYTVLVGLVFLSVIGIILYMILFVEIPPANKDAFMLLAGGIATAGTLALNNMAKGGNQAQAMAAQIEKQDATITKLQAKVNAHEDTIVRLTDILAKQAEGAKAPDVQALRRITDQT